MGNERRIKLQMAVEADGNGNGSGKLTRTTVFLTESLSFYLDVYALQARVAKGRIVRDALKQYFESKGFRKVDQIPNSIQLNISRASG